MQEAQERQVPSLGREDLLEEEVATHSCILAWEMLWAGEPVGLQSMGSQEKARLIRVPMGLLWRSSG